MNTLYSIPILHEPLLLRVQQVRGMLRDWSRSSLASRARHAVPRTNKQLSTCQIFFLLWNPWKCNFPMSPHICQYVIISVIKTRKLRFHAPFGALVLVKVDLMIFWWGKQKIQAKKTIASRYYRVAAGVMERTVNMRDDVRDYVDKTVREWRESSLIEILPQLT